MGTMETGREMAIPELLADKYRVDGELGRGGMGIVLAATHVGLDQQVAIKVLATNAEDDPEATARLLREARAVAKIRSEHVVRVMDVGTLADGRPYIVMERLEGADLAAKLHEGTPFSIEMAVSVLLDACQGLAAAHAVGIVHRDIKPANLFMARQPDRAEVVKVLDFGISKVLKRSDAASPAPDGSITETGRLFGSPSYMSPEQLRSATHADARSDVWACGAVFYEMLMGAPPFGESPLAEVLAAIVRDEPKSMREARPDVPEDLDDAILRCLEKDPNARLQNLAELASAVAPFGPAGSDKIAQRVARILDAAPVASVGGADMPAVDRAPTPPVAKRSPRGAPNVPSVRPPTPGGKNTSLPVVTSVHRPPPAAALDGSPRKTILLLVALGLAGLGVALMGYKQSVRRPVESSINAASPTPPDAAPVLSSTSGGARPSASSTKEEITIEITSAPAGTQVFLGETTLGAAPGTFRFARGDAKVALRFVARGFAPTVVEILPSADRRFSVEMRPSKAEPEKTAPTKPHVPKDLEPF